MHGWRSQPVSTRLAQLAEVTVHASPGFPDRLQMVAEAMLDVGNAVSRLTLLEPRDRLYRLWQRVLKSLENTGTTIIEKQVTPAPSQGDLAACKRASFMPKGDGSLQFLRPGTSGRAAHEVAAWLSTLNGLEQTVIIGPDSVLDRALHRFDLPTTGAGIPAFDNGLLQILPLTLAMGWDPPDPQRALELLMLPTSPIPQGIAQRLSAALQEYPAVGSDAWNTALKEAFENIDNSLFECGGKKMSVWQVAAGDGSRDYADIFLKFGVILVGPGSEGNYFENRSIYDDPNHWAFRPFINTIAEQLRKDDMIILKRPSGYQWEILAVGKVESEYVHNETFGDVDGWDLQHCRIIRWKTPLSKTLVSGLRRGTLFGVNNQTALDEAEKVWENGQAITPERIPDPVDEITVDELIDSIMERGLPVADSENIANTIWKLRRIAKWYTKHGEDVGEHEIRTFLIVPLLTSLGWAEQKIKIEWKNIDIALFDKPYSENSRIRIIIESKRLWDGLLYAPAQAEDYSSNYSSCGLLVVSDGIRYKLYRKEKDDWSYYAYMNLMAPKIRHPYLQEVRGAVDFFLDIMPL